MNASEALLRRLCCSTAASAFVDSRRDALLPPIPVLIDADESSTANDPKKSVASRSASAQTRATAARLSTTTTSTSTSLAPAHY